MNFGVCKLCKCTKELQRSHVIGRSIFRRMMKNSGDHFLVNADTRNKEIKKSTDQFVSYQLCAACESYLNSKYENYSLWSLMNKQKGVKHCDGNIALLILGLDQYRVIMYVISIIWRAVNSDHTAFSQSKIYPELNEYFRMCILDEVHIDEKKVFVKISKLICVRNKYSEEKLQGFIIPPMLKKDGNNGISYSMIFGGFYFEVFVPLVDSFNRYGLGVLRRKKHILRIPKVNFLQIPEVFNSIQKTIEVHNNNKDIKGSY